MSWLKSLLVSMGMASAPVAPPPAMPPAVMVCEPCAVSDEGYELVRTFEGYMPFPYKDVAGIETVGYGYVLRPGDNFTYPLLPLDADALLKKTMGGFERDINRAVVIELKQNQFDALGSWTYNLGSGALTSSTMLKRINAKKHEDVPAEMLKWNKARVNGVLVPVRGLTIRRKVEGNHYAGVK